VVPRRYDDVAVLFACIVDFAAYCEARSAEEVVVNLDHLVEACEELMAAHGLEKIKTIGDCVMATANLLEPSGDPVMAALEGAFAMQQAARDHPAGWQLQIGIHIGPVVAGIVGHTKFSFDLWGDTVNVAARLSTLGATGAIHLSDPAWQRLENRAHGQPLGHVPIKGKGQLQVFQCLHPAV
jgi:class 3 adenylate cyclase